MGEFMPHAILQKKGKKGSVGKQRREHARQGSQKKKLEEMWKYGGVMNRGEGE
jgi:hypothetical protein